MTTERATTHRIPRDQSIRLFKNNFLESLTHVHPIIPLVFWSPVAAWLLWRSVGLHQIAAAELALCALAGLIVWTLTEYFLHRVLFHFPAKSRVSQYLVFMFHGVHHDAPRDKTRLVMPPAGAVIIMAGLWMLFSAVIPSPHVEPFTAFFIIGYLIYDYIHYATHHFPMRHPWMHFLKTYHLKHHYAEKGVRYGVSTPLWDLVFGTYPRDTPKDG